MDRFSPERWQQVDALFSEALERSPGEREAFLRAACADDEALRRAVDVLLESAAAAEAALGESATDYAEPLLAELGVALEEADRSSLPENERVGPYRIVREVGRGGMGTVYLAERADGHFERHVALKLVKRGMDTDEVLRRFRHERQILASLEHLHIARLYDGGVAEDGRPYLVMEHIDGVPITRFCDERRLSVEERLRLFARVCEAVHFAHRSLVIHRDIKPSNILVTADGTPKLLDFGIAKLLDPTAGGQRTRTEIRLLTPEYAAPEQSEGGLITTATDVYALGVVLYELLTGRRPREERGRGRDDGSDGAERPSAVVTRGTGAPVTTPGDIAERRATTAERLRRRLRGDLDTIVLRAVAPEPERRYPSAERLAADVERHLRGLPVEARSDSALYRAQKFVRRNRVGVIAVSLIALSLAGGLGTSLFQARRAVRERDLAQRERARAEQVSGFLFSLFEAADPRADRPEGADTLRARHLVDLGAQRVRRELAGQPRLQAEMLATLGRIYASLGLYDSGQSLLRDALALQRSPTRERATTLTLLGELHRKKGEPLQADSVYRQVHSLYDAQGWKPDSLYVFALSERGVALNWMGHAEEAAALHERAYAQVRRLSGESSLLYSYVVNNLAELLHGQGDFARAEPLFREALQVTRASLGPHHPGLAESLNNLASTIHYQGRYAEAEPLYREAIAVATWAYGESHPETGQFLENLATLHDDRGDHAGAESLYRKAIPIYEASFGRGNARTAKLLHNLATNRYDAGDLAAAETLAREAIATFSAELGADHVYTSLARRNLGRSLSAAGRTAEALPLLRAALASMERELPAGHFRIHATRSDLGACLSARGEYRQAEPILLSSYAALRKDQGDESLETRYARRNLRRLYAAWGKPEIASRYADLPPRP